MGNALLLWPFSLPFKDIGTISAFSGLLRLLSCPNVSEHSFTISSFKNLPIQIQFWVDKFGNCHLTCSSRTTRPRSNCVQCPTTTAGHFICNSKDILKFHCFNNTSHVHLLLYSYYHWFKPLIAPLCVCFTCSFLAQIFPFIYLFFQVCFYLPSQPGWVLGFSFLTNLSLSLFWDCSLANLIKQFANTISIFLLQCFSSSLLC